MARPRKTKDSFEITFRHIAIIKHLYFKCEDGRFLNLKELAISLGVGYKTILNDINELAENDIINLIYSDDKKEYAKTFTLPSKSQLHTLLKPHITACENSLISIYNITSKESCLDMIKF